MTKYLRLFGFDSKYNSELDDLKIATISKEETRIVLTRDRGLLKRNMITHGYLIRSLIPKEQVVEVFARFDLYNITQPFTRCMKCNGELIPIEKEKIKNKLLDNTYSSFDQFYICDQCDQIYWKGSHYNKLIDLIQKFQNK